MSIAVACSTVVKAVARLAPSVQAPVVVGIDGRSGAGKSTLASRVAHEVKAAVVRMDDFFAASIRDTEWDSMTVEERAERVFDWSRLRSEAIRPLLAGRAAHWHPFDFDAGPRADGTYGIKTIKVEVHPAPVILLDGAYSCGRQLSDLVSLRVLAELPDAERRSRLMRREEPEFLKLWGARWDGVEEFYFSLVRPSSCFDVIART